MVRAVQYDISGGTSLIMLRVRSRCCRCLVPHNAGVISVSTLRAAVKYWMLGGMKS